MNEAAVKEIQIDGLTEKEAREFKELLSKFVKSYSAKDSSISDREWLKNEFRSELADLSEERADKLAEETLDSIKEYDENLKDLNECCKKGKSKEKWFADKISKASSGVSVIDYGNYLNSIDTAITNANAQMMRTVITNEGNISQCINLDGYIAEQAHVNRFNIESELRKSRFYAEVKVPGPGETYGKNSFDIVIKDGASGGNVPVHQYQVKYGANAKETIKLLSDADGRCRYNNQTIVVPPEQLEDVQKAFPGKTVTDKIGHTDKVKFGSKGFTKAEVKEMQLDAQNKNCIPRTDWNSFNAKQLALNIGKQAGIAGLGAAAVTTGFSLTEQVVRGEGIDACETVELALKTGADAGIKAATAGAIKVGAEKGVLSIIPKGTPVGTIANIACVAIENLKILGKVAVGKLTTSQGLEHMGRTTVSMAGGLSWGAKGMGVGAWALSWIPVVGPIVGGFAGGMIGYMAGSKVGSAIFNGVKKVTSAAVKTIKSVGNAIKSGFHKVKNMIFG